MVRSKEEDRVRIEKITKCFMRIRVVMVIRLEEIALPKSKGSTPTLEEHS